MAMKDMMIISMAIVAVLAAQATANTQKTVLDEENDVKLGSTYVKYSFASIINDQVQAFGERMGTRLSEPKIARKLLILNADPPITEHTHTNNNDYNEIDNHGEEDTWTLVGNDTDSEDEKDIVVGSETDYLGEEDTWPLLEKDSDIVEDDNDFKYIQLDDSEDGNDTNDEETQPLLGYRNEED